MSIDKQILIIGERGQVSMALQNLLKPAGYRFTVLSTSDVLARKVSWEQVRADLIVLCTQDFASESVVAEIPHQFRILDVSPQFRMDKNWVYGLPELPGQSQAIANAHRVANPGCFATAAILAIAPLVNTHTIPVSQSIYIDGSGGYTTGGPKLIDKAMLGELDVETVCGLSSPHPHVAEIQQFARVQGRVFFKPKITNVPRGIRVMVTFERVQKEVVDETYARYYGAFPEIILAKAPSHIPVDFWAGRPGAHIATIADQGSTTVIVSLDNLGKGAVDSAFRNIQLMLTNDEEPT